ncbi:putative ABC transporter permease subunit [Anaerolinea thermolimosa]|nr:hypothetical protein [Anaerolinea thermolimosa]
MPFREPGLWASVWKLLRLRLLIQVNGFRRAKLRTKIALILGVLGVLALSGSVLFISISLLQFLRSPELARLTGDLTAVLEGFPVMLVSASAVGILVTGFGVLLQALYLAGDMDFLMSAPIPIRAVFIAKLVQAILPNFGILSLFTLPLLFGLGASGGYHFLFYPLTVLMLVMLTLAAASLAGLLVMVAARFVPARRLAEVLGFVVGTAVFAFSQGSRYYNFELNPEQMHSLLRVVERFDQPWSPLAWAGHGLIALGKGNWPEAGGWLTAAMLVTGGVFFTALRLSERLYFTGWSRMQNNRRRRLPSASEQSAAGERGRLTQRLGRMIPAYVRAILVKDWLSYRRDLRNLSRLITPLIVGVVYAIGLLRPEGRGIEGEGNAPAFVTEMLRGILLYGDVALALLLGWMLAVNLAGPSISMEGKSYWVIKSSPLSPGQLLTAKFLVAYLPTLGVSGVYLMALQLLKGSPPLTMVISLFAVALASAGLVGLFMALGVPRSKFDWEDPRQTNTVGCLGSLIGFAYLPVCFGLFIGPVFLANLLKFPTLAGQLAGLVLGGTLAVMLVVVPRPWLIRRIPRLGE